MLPSLKKNSTRKGPQDLVALDFGTSGLKVARIKKLNGIPTLVGADILKPVRLDHASEDAKKSAHIELPKNLRAHYAPLTFTSEKAIVRVVTLPGHETDSKAAEKAIRDHVGLDESFRVASVTLQHAKSRNETRVLAVAIPQADAAAVLACVSSGAPAPHTLEVAGVSALNGALLGPLTRHANEAVIAIECGAHTSMMAVFNKGSLILARKLELGGFALIQSIQRQFSVDAEIALSMLSQGDIDLSTAVRQVIDPFLRQLVISRDFVERQENCRITAAYISGGMSLTSSWVSEIQKAIGMAVNTWDPFEGIAMAPGAYPDALQGQQPRFAAAIGSLKAALQDAEKT